MSYKKLHEENANVYVTDGGITIELQAVSHVLLSEIDEIVRREFEQAGKPIKSPQYETKLADGRTVMEDHTEETLAYPMELALADAENDADKAQEIVNQRTREAVQQWQAYLEAVAEMESEAANRRRDFMLRRGIKTWDGGRIVPADWVAQCVDDGFTPPTEPRELEMYWFLRGLLCTVNDQIEVITRIMGKTASGVGNEHVAGALQFFRHKMAGQGETDQSADPAGETVLDDEPAGSGS